MRRVDGQRGQHREHLVPEQLGEPLAGVVVQLVPPHDGDALLGQRRLDGVAVDPRVPRHQRLGPARDVVEDVARLVARGRAHRDPRGDAPLEARDADHVELVEVAGEDGEEARALQQRDLGVLGQLQHPGVERQPRHLAVGEAVLGQVVRVVGHDLGRCPQVLDDVVAVQGPGHRARGPTGVGDGPDGRGRGTSGSHDPDAVRPGGHRTRGIGPGASDPAAELDVDVPAGEAERGVRAHRRGVVRVHVEHGLVQPTFAQVTQPDEGDQPAEPATLGGR